MRSLFTVSSPAGSLREAGDAIAVRVDGLPGRELNRIVGLYDLTQLDDLADLYGEGQYWVSLDPEAALDGELMSRGFVPDGAWQKFERGVEPLRAPTELDITDASTPGDFGFVIRATWGVPPDAERWLSGLVGRPGWHCLVAYDGGEPVAAGMLYAEGETGWLGVASTLVEHRGRGAQSGLLAARIERARELGLRLLVTETGALEDGDPGPSFRNIVRAGFEPAYVRPNYTPA